jgi:hypothetical protein
MGLFNFEGPTAATCGVIAKDSSSRITFSDDRAETGALMTRENSCTGRTTTRSLFGESRVSFFAVILLNALFTSLHTAMSLVGPAFLWNSQNGANCMVIGIV